MVSGRLTVDSGYLSKKERVCLPSPGVAWLSSTNRTSQSVKDFFVKVLLENASEQIDITADTSQALIARGVMDIWANHVIAYHLPLDTPDRVFFVLQQLLYRVEWQPKDGSSLEIDTSTSTNYPDEGFSGESPLYEPKHFSEKKGGSVTFTDVLFARLNKMMTQYIKSGLGGGFLNKLAENYSPRSGAFAIFDSRPPSVKKAVDNVSHHRPFLSGFWKAVVTPEVISQGQFLPPKNYPFPMSQEAYVYRLGGPSYTAKWPTQMNEMRYVEPSNPQVGTFVDNLCALGKLKENRDVSVFQASFDESSHIQEFNFKEDVLIQVIEGACDFHTEMGRFSRQLQVGDIVKLPAAQVASITGDGPTTVRIYSAEEIQLSCEHYPTLPKRDQIALKAEIPFPIANVPESQRTLHHFRINPVTQMPLRGDCMEKQSTRLNIVDVSSECAHPVLFSASLFSNGLYFQTVCSGKISGSLFIKQDERGAVVGDRPQLKERLGSDLYRLHTAPVKLKFNVDFSDRKKDADDKTILDRDTLIVTPTKEDFIATFGVREVVFKAENDMVLYIENGQICIGRIHNECQYPLKREDGVTDPCNSDVIFIKKDEVVFCKAKRGVAQVRGLISRAPLNFSIITLGGITRPYDRRHAIRPARSNKQDTTTPVCLKPALEWSSYEEKMGDERDELTREGMFLYQSKHINPFRPKDDHPAPVGWGTLADVDNCSADYALIPLRMKFNGKPPGEFYLHNSPHGPKLPIILSDQNIMIDRLDSGDFADPSGHYPYPHSNQRRSESGGLLLIDKNANPNHPFTSLYQLLESSAFEPIFINEKMANLEDSKRPDYDAYGHGWDQRVHEIISQYSFVPGLI